MRILGEKNFLIPTPDGMQRVFLRGQMNFFGSPIDWFREIILIPFSGYFFPTNMRYQFLSFAQSAISWHVDANAQQPKAFNSCDLQCSCLQKSEIADREKVAKTENKEKKLQIFLSQHQPADLDGKKDSFDEQMSEICLQ